MACVLAVVVESVGVGREGEGALVLFPKAVDGLGHVGRADAPYPGQVGLFPFIDYPCVGDQVIVTYGISDPVEKPFRGGKQLLYPESVFLVIAAVVFRDVWKVIHVMVAVQEHRVFPMLPFVFNDLHEIPLQLLDGEVQVGVEVVTDEDIDAVIVNETFPGVPSVNVADDVVGGHGMRCLIMVAKIAVSWNMWPCCLMKGFWAELRFRCENHKDMITTYIILY